MDIFKISVISIALSLSVFAAENAQVVQTNLNLQSATGNASPSSGSSSSSDSASSISIERSQPQQPEYTVTVSGPDSSVKPNKASVVEVQQEISVNSVNGGAPGSPQQQSQEPQQIVIGSPTGSDFQNLGAVPVPQSGVQQWVTPEQQQEVARIQYLKEANSQYQYQINSRYEEKTRPIYASDRYQSNYYPTGDISSQYSQYPQYPQYASVQTQPPYHRQNSNYQEQGVGQRRDEGLYSIGNNANTQYENSDQSEYSQKKTQAFTEYGKGEYFPEYNTYAYKRTYL